ncbi:hypothetical protein [Serratia bockelmannii]|uniref:hypothetical protein n=1 Tax=Serratia bockelmannii TaxID=2703793 RepID=UPI003FA6CF87
MRLLVLFLAMSALSGCVQQRASVSIVSTAPLSVYSEIVDGHVVVHCRTGASGRD